MSAKESAIEKLKGLGVPGDKATGIVEDIIAAAVMIVLGETVSRGAEKAPALIQGYTAEQWQEIIDGGYLCEFSMNGNFTRCPVYCTLQEFDSGGGSASFLPHPAKGIFAYCRPAQLKGVIRPIWVKPTSQHATCIFFDSGVEALCDKGRHHFAYSPANSSSFTDDAVCYMEVEV